MRWSSTLRPQPEPAHRRAEREAILADPGFGVNFTDHMAVATWTAADGWHDSAIVPYGPFALDPATAVLHYAQEIFEGLKAYRHADGSVWLFRPEKNAERFARSAHRLALPVLPPTTSWRSIEALVARRRGLGARGRRSRACTCGRSCSPPRRSSASAPAHAGDLLLHRQPGRARTSPPGCTR